MSKDNHVGPPRKSQTNTQDQSHVLNPAISFPSATRSISLPVSSVAANLPVDETTAMHNFLPDKIEAYREQLHLITQKHTS